MKSIRGLKGLGRTRHTNVAKKATSSVIHQIFKPEKQIDERLMKNAYYARFMVVSVQTHLGGNSIGCAAIPIIKIVICKIISTQSLLVNNGLC